MAIRFEFIVGLFDIDLAIVAKATISTVVIGATILVVRCDPSLTHSLLFISDSDHFVDITVIFVEEKRGI
nr:hypothetical protein CFP56_40459 [Quercus suber]